MILSLEESLSIDVREKFKTYLTNTIIGKEKTWRKLSNWNVNTKLLEPFLFFKISLEFFYNIFKLHFKVGKWGETDI